MVFQPGQSANPGGRPKERPFRDALRLELAAAGTDQKALRGVARALIRKASAGDINAANMIADRIDGKVAQPIAGDDEAPPISVIVTGVPRKSDTSDDGSSAPAQP